MRKYQVWIGDAYLCGHVVMYDNDPEEEVQEYAVQHARQACGPDIAENDVSVCEIPDTYYQDIVRASAPDSIEFGM